MEAEGRQTPVDAVEALRRSEERYALAQRAANIGSWDWDIRTNDLHWSDRIEPMFGLVPGQFGATHAAFLECVHPDDRRGVVDSINASVEKGDDYAIEYRIVWPDGTVRWVSETGDVIRDGQGRAVRMLGIVQDITGRKKVEETLRRSEANYRTIFDSASDAIFVHDIDDAKIMSVNEKACQMYGYTRDEFEQLAVEDISTDMPPHIQEKAVRWIRKAVEEGPQLIEWMCKDKTGRQFWVEVNLKATVIEDRKCVLAIVRDITERREVDEVIQENESLFRNLFENAGEALFLVNPDGGGFVGVNQRACDALGYTREELLKMCVSDIDSACSREKFAEFVRKLESDEPVTLEASYRRKDDTTFPVEIRTGLIEIKRERRLLSMARDISERKIARAEIESLAKFPSENPSPVLRIADNGVLLYANDAGKSLVAEWGCRVGRVVPEQWCRTTSEVLASASSKRVEAEHEGRVFAFVVTPVADSDYVNLYGRDITDRKDMEARRQLAGRILECLNRGRLGADLVRDVLKLVKDATGFDAVGIRHREGDDFPYLEVDGFPDDFVDVENCLCSRDEAGEPIYDSQGRPIMECLCGNVLRGRADPALPFFTEGGSFWTNSTTELLARTLPEALRVPTRNQCNRAGYESVALIPLRSGDEIVGLLQLNDARPGRFTPEIVGFFEEIGASIGIGMARIRAEADLREYWRHLEELVQTRTAELTQANETLLQQIEERKRLEKEILNISEREQRRIGRELHDSIGQQFTGIAFMMKVLEQKLADKLSDEAAGAAEIKELVNQAMDQTRGLAKGLHPVDLDAGSLTAVLQELAATTEKMFGIRCALKCDETVPIDNAEVATHLYRITQEAITNAVKHGKTKNIWVELARNEGATVLTVENDGLDFPEGPESGRGGMGLHIMNHRADIIGASLDIRKAAKDGTILTCSFRNNKR